MPPAPAGPTFPVRIDELVLREDLAHASKAGRAAILPVLKRLSDIGAPLDWLKRCQTEHRDGTNLSGCVKLYIPQPIGPWGAVLTGDKKAGSPTLVLLAVGQRHPTQPWAPSVYQIAHQRLHATNHDGQQDLP